MPAVPRLLDPGPGNSRHNAGFVGQHLPFNMRNWLHNNGLSVAVLGTFLFLLVAQSVVGWASHNEDLAQKGASALGYLAYLASGHFHEAVSENWESEFLQMAAYVLLTVALRQKGSSESKSPDGSEEVDYVPLPETAPPDAPYPVRRGGWLLTLYQNSLTIAFLALFLASFVWHMVGGHALENDERRLDGLSSISFFEYISSSGFWFESLQNWQSEFLAVGAIVVLSIWLRQKGSPESKPVAAPHSATGG